MRAVVQRVTQASVSVEGRTIGQIGHGLMVLLGVGHGDTQAEAQWLAHKVANLRVFSDAEDKMNLGILDTGGAVLVVSQFTLYANTRKGFRPSFVPAAPPEIAEPLVEVFIEALRGENVPVQSGKFRADMQVALVNDGPVTIILEKDPPQP